MSKIANIFLRKYECEEFKKNSAKKGICGKSENRKTNVNMGEGMKDDIKRRTLALEDAEDRDKQRCCCSLFYLDDLG